MKPGGQRRKGHSWERGIASMLRPIYGEQVKRGFQTRGGGKEAPDVDGTPYHIEAKHGVLVNLRAALAQAIADTDGRPPVVIAKDNRTEPVVLMRLTDWLELAKDAETLRKMTEGLKDLAEKAAADTRSAVERGGVW